MPFETLVYMTFFSRNYPKNQSPRNFSHMFRNILYNLYKNLKKIYIIILPRIILSMSTWSNFINYDNKIYHKARNSAKEFDRTRNAKPLKYPITTGNNIRHRGIIMKKERVAIVGCIRSCDAKSLTERVLITERESRPQSWRSSAGNLTARL